MNTTGPISQSLKTEINNAAQEAQKDNFSQPDDNHLDNIFTQRQFQRKFIFWFAITITGLSSILLGGIIFCLVFSPILFPHKISLLNGYELEIFSAGVFTQFIGVIIVITKSLWDDSNYKDLLRNRNKS